MLKYCRSKQVFKAADMQIWDLRNQNDRSEGILMSIVMAVAVPHPPVILPEIGKGQEREIRRTIEAYRTAADRIRGQKPRGRAANLCSFRLVTEALRLTNA